MFLKWNSKFRWIAILCCALCCSIRIAKAAEPAGLFQSLTESGVLVGPQAVRLREPTLTGNLSANEQQRLLENLAGKIGWERFSRDSVSAPVAIDIERINDASGQSIGHRIHSAFVVYASLEELREELLMTQLFGTPAESEEGMQVVELEPSEVAGLNPTDLGSSTSAQAEKFAYLELPLLNKVHLRGVIQIDKRERSGSVEFAWQFDHRFDKVDQYASRWTKLERDAVGKLERGQTFAYSGCAGMLGVYAISDEIGDSESNGKRLLVESHMVMHEPMEWFSGSNLLRSKLPLLLQENARSFRRKLSADR